MVRGGDVVKRRDHEGGERVTGMMRGMKRGALEAEEEKEFQCGL